MTGNVCLFIGYIIIYFLYYFGSYNPWLENKDSMILLPEDAFRNSVLFMIALFGAATLPPIICYLLSRYDKSNNNIY